MATTTTYQVGDVLLCHKHIGVAKFVGTLHDNDYLQLSSTSQTLINPSELWVGLQLAEQPDVHTLSLRESSHHHFRSLSFRDYFSAHYGLLIPHKCIHKKILPYECLAKLTQVFHALKNTRKQNVRLRRRIEQLQSELARGVQSKKVQSTSQKSLESIIVDQNGNSYHRQTKITHTTTHSYHQAQFNKHNSQQQQQQQQQPQARPDTSTSSNLRVIVTTPDRVDGHHEDGDAQSTSFSEKATEGIKDYYSDRGVMSDDGDDDEDDDNQEEEPEEEPRAPQEPQQEDDDEKQAHHKSDDVINEDNEASTAAAAAAVQSAADKKQAPPHRSSHARRYSAPYTLKKIQTREFGSAYEKTHDPYWKNSGSRSVQFEHNNDLQQSAEIENSKQKRKTDRNTDHKMPPPATSTATTSRTIAARVSSQHGHDAQDSAEWNMLPMIKQDPVANTIYRMSKINLRETHKRSASMSVVNASRYFFERDNGEFPDLPDL